MDVDPRLPLRQERALAWVGLRADADAGERVGTVEAVLVDWRTGEPRWVAVALRGRHYAVGVPVEGVLAGNGRLYLPHARDRILRTPPLPARATRRLVADHDLLRHYGRPEQARAMVVELTGPGVWLRAPASRTPAPAPGVAPGSPPAPAPPERLRDPSAAVAPPAATGAPPTTGAPAPADPIRVVVCDDVEAFRRLMVVHLEEDPELQVVGEAANGNDALRVVSGTRPHVVLLDMAMPVMDGLTALPLVQAAWPGAQIVGLSGFGSPQLEAVLRATGAAAYLEKGIDLGEIVATVRDLGRQAQAAGVR